jgi:hypothetical protein
MKNALPGRKAAKRIVTASVAAGLLLPKILLAFDFTPTPVEWASWPDYCKARYVTTEVGKRSAYASMFPLAGVQRWQTLIGDATFGAVHHYCHGLVLLRRANMARSEQERLSLLRNAESECRFTFERIPPTSPLYREIAMNMQFAQTMLGAARPVMR